MSLYITNDEYVDSIISSNNVNLFTQKNKANLKSKINLVAAGALTFTLTFNANGGTGTIPPISK